MTRPTALFLGLVLALSPAALASEPDLCVRPGEPFPNLSFEGLLSPEDYTALGLAAGEGPVRLQDISGDLLVLEFFNKYCLTCWRQAPQLQSFQDLLRPGDLEGRVKILSVGAGNSEREVREFRNEFQLRYPLAPDPGFAQFYAMGEPGGAPCTAFLLRRQGQWMLADFHVGFYGDAEMLARARALLRGWAKPPTRVTGAETLAADEGEVREQMAAFLGRLAGKPVDAVPVTLKDGARVWRAVAQEGPLPLFGRAAAREPICDLCHTILFLFAFDDDGIVKGFEPLFVTKFGNELWSPEEASGFEKKVSGRKIYDLPFDPTVDAVTSATMSSALIFDEMRRVARYLPEVQ